MLLICDFWLIYNNTLNALGKGKHRPADWGLNDGVGWGGWGGAVVVFLLETVNLISQHSSHNRKSNSVRAALSISCLAAQVDKCTAELIYSAYILDILMLFFFFFLLVTQMHPHLLSAPVVHMSLCLIYSVFIPFKNPLFGLNNWSFAVC